MDACRSVWSRWLSSVSPACFERNRPNGPCRYAIFPFDVVRYCFLARPFGLQHGSLELARLDFLSVARSAAKCKRLSTCTSCTFPRKRRRAVNIHEQRACQDASGSKLFKRRQHEMLQTKRAIDECGCHKFWVVLATRTKYFCDLKVYAILVFPQARCAFPYREKQLRLWCDMVLRWHHMRREYVFGWRDWPLWENHAIGRKLGSEGAEAVVEELIRTGHAEWNDAGKSMVTLMWHSADEIAAKLFDFVRKHDMAGSVFTVYELHHGDEVSGTVRTAFDGSSD